jgi:hypothetical protein
LLTQLIFHWNCIAYTVCIYHTIFFLTFELKICLIFRLYWQLCLIWSILWLIVWFSFHSIKLSTCFSLSWRWLFIYVGGIFLTIILWSYWTILSFDWIEIISVIINLRIYVFIISKIVCFGYKVWLSRLSGIVLSMVMSLIVIIVILRIKIWFTLFVLISSNGLIFVISLLIVCKEVVVS